MPTPRDIGRAVGLREALGIAEELRATASSQAVDQQHQRRMAARIIKAIRAKLADIETTGATHD